MSAHVCDANCDRLKTLLRQGSKNGVWESLLREHDARLIVAAHRCSHVEVRPVGNKALIVLKDDSTRCVESAGNAPTRFRSSPSSSSSSSSSPTSAIYRRVEVSWADDANLFFVHDVEAKPNYLPQIEETLRYLKGAQKPLLDREIVVGNRGIVRCSDVGWNEDGWLRSEITRLDQDGVLVFHMDHGGTTKIARRGLFVMPRFVMDYPPQALRCRLKNPAGERILWSPLQSKYFRQILQLHDFQLYSLEDLRTLSLAAITSTGASAVIPVKFFVKFPNGVVKSVVDTIQHLEEVARDRLAFVDGKIPQSLPLTPTSPPIVQAFDQLSLVTESFANSLATLPPGVPPATLAFERTSPAAPQRPQSRPSTPCASPESVVGSAQATVLPPDATLPPDMVTPAIGDWETVRIPKAYRLSLIRPDRFIICSSYADGLKEKFRNFDEVMYSAPFLNDGQVVKGGCYAALVARHFVDGDSGERQRVNDLTYDSEKTWVRVVATEREGGGLGRWRCYCGDLGVWCPETVSYKDLRHLPALFRKDPFQAVLAELTVEPSGEDVVKSVASAPTASKGFSNEAFKFLVNELRGASSLYVHVANVQRRLAKWPCVKLSLSSLIRVDKDDKCIVRAMIKKKLVKMKA